MAKPATIVGETFTSISLQIKRLIIASELQEDEMKLKRTADAVRVLSSHMVKMVQRVIACLKEEDAQVQVARSCDRISAAADSLVVASQMVDISGFGFRRCGSLVDQATVLHEATVELLKVASIVGASSVARCSQNIHPALNSLLSARDPNDLEELARNYSEVVSCFENDVNEMSVLICEAVNFQAVSSSIDALKKSIPLLNASLKTLLTYREIEEAQVSRNNVVGLVLSSLDSLSNALHEKNQNWPLISYSSLEVKQFTAVCNELVEKMKLIATRKSMSSQDLTDLDVQLNHIVQYAMDLAAEAGKESKSNIFKSCSTLMENQNKISQQSQSSLHSALHDGKYSVSVSTEWSHLQIDCLSRLQVEVVKTLPKVIISFLIKDHMKPVFDLLKALKERNHSKDLLPEAKEPATSSGDKLQFCADQFRVELNDFCTGMRLIVAGANLNPTDGREMRQSICTAEKLGKRILLEMEKLLRSNDLGRSDWHPGSLETDCDDWCILADDLLGNTDKLVDAVEGLLMLCGEMIWKMVSSHSHSSKDEALDESVVLMTRRFIRLSAKVNDKHLDGWLRSRLRRKIAALEHDLSELKRSDGLERWRCGTGSDTTCFYRLLQQSVSDICWCVKTGRLTKDPHEEPISVVRTAFDSLIDDALNESTSTELKESEVNFDLLTSLGLHGSAFCEIKEIIDSLIFGAVSGSAGAEMRPGRLLFTSSHILHSALLVLGTVEQKDRKRSFILDKLAELADFVPMILDEADMIRSFRKYDLERLYELGEKLCHTMSLLINFVDDILLRWNPLPQNLVIAAMAGDWSLLKREAIGFRLRS